MKHAGKVIWITLCTLLICAQAIAQDPVKKVSKLYTDNQRDSALTLIEYYMPIYQDQEKWDTVVALQRLKATVYSAERGLQAALDEFDLAENLAKEHLEVIDEQYLQVLLKKGNCLLQMHNYEACESYLNQVLQHASNITDTVGFAARAYADLAWMFHVRKKYQQALDAAGNALQLTLALDPVDSFALLQCYRVLGLTNEHLGRIDSTHFYKSRAFQLMQELYPPGHVNIGIAHLDMMGYYFEVQDMAKAMDHVKKAEAIFADNYLKNGQGRYLAIAMNNVGLIYSVLGEKQLSYTYQSKGLGLLQKDFGEMNPIFIESYCSMAELEIDRGNHNSAKEWLDKASTTLKGGQQENKEQENYINTFYSKLYLGEGKVDKALEIALALYDYYEIKNETYSKRGINIASRLSEIYMNKKDYDKSQEWANHKLRIIDSLFSNKGPAGLEILNKKLEIARATNNDALFEQTSREILRRMHSGSGELRLANCYPASQLVDYAGHKAEYLADKMHSEPSKVAAYYDFIDDFETYYNQHLSIIRSNQTIAGHAAKLKTIYGPGLAYFVDHDKSAALIFSEKIKAFLTRIILQSHMIQSEDGGARLQLDLNKTLALMVEDNSDSLYLRAGKLMEDFNRHKDSLLKDDPLAYNKAYGFPELSEENMFADVGRNEGVLAYAVVDSSLYVMGKLGGQIFTKTLAFQNVLDLLDRPDQGALKQLYGMLIPEPMRATKRYFIVPDGALYHFNFEQLVDDNDRFLLETKRIRYAYSASVYSYQKRINAAKGRYPTRLMAITPGFSDGLKEAYISSAKNEWIDSAYIYFVQQPFLRELAERLGRMGGTRVFTGVEATESAVKNHASGCRVIHIGTHGIIDDGSPLFSKLVFAKDSLEDGYLHTYEIYGQRLDADLAVLSACESGTGNLSSGEGVLSLAHAFTHAGCPSVLMSLWKIDERSSAQILERFYEYLMDGYSKSTSLRKAKLDYLASAPPELRAPYYWAGLIIMGEDSPVASPWLGYRKWWLAGGLTLVLFGLIYVGRRINEA
jgi:tetratricopeptide (TPR) repeat protein